jgi:hypothetical protein
MSPVGRALAALSGAACIGAILTLATAPTAAAAPTALQVSPALAPSGTAVTVSGSTCAGPVDLALVSLVGGALTTVDTATATPSPEGTWSTTVSMPAAAAHVTATCDGSSAIPVVLGPDPQALHQRLATMLGTNQVVFEQTGLVEGSLYRVVSLDGTELGVDVVTNGLGRVVLPWTAERSQVLALELLPWGTGMLPFIQQIDIPLNERLTMAPLVAHTGAPITLSGDRCPGGRVQIGLSGESSGWFDLPATYPGATLTVGAAGTWSHTFSAPPEVASVTVGCQVPDGRSYFRQFVLGSLSGPSHPGAVTLTRIGAILQADPFGPLTAYRPDGSPVPLTRVGGSSVFVQGRPGKILVVEHVSFGENAEALVVDSPRQVLFDVPAPAKPPPVSAPAVTPRADPPRAGADPASAPAAAPAEIAATGSAPTEQVVLGVGLLLLGLALQKAARAHRLD